MNNHDIQAAWKYHDSTKHSDWSIRNNPHFLDWANRPQPFKIYPKLERLPLPRDVSQTGVAALSALSDALSCSRADSVPDLQDLARILYFSAGITKQRGSPGGEIYFRAAACTGALYEIELYLVTGDVAGLDAGVYHFNPADVSLRLPRKGDFRGNLAQATALEPAVVGAPVTIICTGTYWRNAWKYQARTYRHFGWDNGTLLARHKETSYRVSRSSTRFTSASTNPSTILAGNPEAAETASIFSYRSGTDRTVRPQCPVKL